MKGTHGSFFPDIIRNMVEVRACVYFSVFFLCFHLAAGKPLFGLLFYCDLFCDDDDDSSTTTTSTEDPMDFLMCGACGPRGPRTTTSNPLTPNPMQNPMNFVIPASSNAMNLTWYPGSNGFIMMPWGQSGAPPANGMSAPPPTAATAATTVAPTTAAPAA